MNSMGAVGDPAQGIHHVPLFVSVVVIRQEPEPSYIVLVKVI